MVFTYPHIHIHLVLLEHLSTDYTLVLSSSMNLSEVIALCNLNARSLVSRNSFFRLF